MRRMFDSQSSVWLKVASAYQIAHFWAYRKRKFWVNLNLRTKVASFPDLERKIVAQLLKVWFLPLFFAKNESRIR